MKFICLDLETTQLDEITGHREVDILGYGLASNKYSTSVEWGHDSIASLHKLNKQAIQGDLMWVFHNASFDVPVLRRHGIEVKPGTYHDTQIISWVLDPSQELYNLDSCCHRYGVAGKFQKPENWTEWTQYMAEYCKQDCISTITLFHKVKKLLEADAKAWNLYETVELPYIECIIEFEDTGFLIDSGKLTELIDDLEIQRSQYLATVLSVASPIPDKLKLEGGVFVPDDAACAKYYPKATQHQLNGPMVRQLCSELFPIEQEQEMIELGWVVSKRNTKTVRMYNDQWVPDPTHVPDFPLVMVGHNRGVWPHCKLKQFNPNSGQQLAYLLHKDIGWVPSKYTKTGQPKTDEEALGWMRDEHPFIDAYLKLTEASKMLDSFLYKFDRLKDEEDILRGSFNHTGTCTGRLSASNP